ncbi:MAG: PAS domain S-box protein [Bacteroidota bacterium]
MTDLRKAQKQIQISEAKFRGAFEYSAIGMSIVSLEGRWLQVNREFTAMVGYSEEELVGMHFRDITHMDDVDENIDLFKQAANGERESYRMEKRYIHKQGNIVWVRLNVSMIKDDIGNPIYCVAQIEDVTQEKLANPATHGEPGESSCNDQQYQHSHLVRRCRVQAPDVQ